MEGNSGDRASVVKPKRIILNVLSNEVPDKTTLDDCTASTTVAELKVKICSAVPSKPAPERQRLIYRGRPLFQDTATLRDVFTQEMVSLSRRRHSCVLMTMQIDNSQELSLHLVLPPPTASHVPQQAHGTGHTIPNGMFHPNAPPHGRRTPVNFQHVHAGAMPPNPPFIPPQPGAFPVPQGAFPPHVQTALHNHLQMLGQQLGAQMAMQGNPASMVQGPPNPNVMHNPQQEAMAFQQYVRQQQQARATAGQHGAGDNAAGANAPNHAATTGPAPVAPASPGQLPNTNAPPPNTNTVIQENRGPNGESWRMVIQSTSTVTGLNQAMQRMPNQSSAVPQPQPQSVNQSDLSPATGLTPSTNSGQGPPRAPNQMQLRILEQEMNAIQTALTRGTAPAATVYERARGMLTNIENVGETPGLEAMLRNQLEVLSAQADQIRASLNNRLLQAVSDHSAPQAPQAAIQAIPTQQVSPQANASSVYILSSPNGPQALLVSPSGTYSAQWPTQPRSNVGLPLIMQHHHHHQPSPTQQPDYNDPAAPEQHPRIVPGDGAQPQAQHQHQHVHANGEARDVLRLLLPIGGHIWLLIRLFGFVYFFTAGGSSRRAFLLGGIAFLVFIVQTGIFRPIWDPLRRHVEGLVAGNDQRPGGLPAHAANAPAPGADQARDPTGEPSPQEAAARLLQQRNQQNIGTLRELFRSVERAIALFVGSLVPGFGERHIAARDAAEAVRQAEAREREEAARRTEEDEAARRETAEGREPPGPRNNQADQPPLVEI